MVNLDLIKEKLPVELHESAQQFDIPDEFLMTMSDLIALVLNSKSIDNKEEKQSWFSLLPMMSIEQINKLRDILVREKEKLQEIEKKYETKKEEIRNKYVQKWENNGYKSQMIKIQEKEMAKKEKEMQEAEDLLINL